MSMRRAVRSSLFLVVATTAFACGSVSEEETEEKDTAFSANLFSNDYCWLTATVEGQGGCHIAHGSNVLADNPLCAQQFVTNKGRGGTCAGEAGSAPSFALLAAQKNVVLDRKTLTTRKGRGSLPKSPVFVVTASQYSRFSGGTAHRIKFYADCASSKAGTVAFSHKFVHSTVQSYREDSVDSVIRAVDPAPSNLSTLTWKTVNVLAGKSFCEAIANTFDPAPKFETKPADDESEGEEGGE